MIEKALNPVSVGPSLDFFVRGFNQIFATLYVDQPEGRWLSETPVELQQIPLCCFPPSHHAYFQLSSKCPLSRCHNCASGCELSQPEATDCQIIVCDQIIIRGNIFSQMRILSHGGGRLVGETNRVVVRFQPSGSELINCRGQFTNFVDAGAPSGHMRVELRNKGPAIFSGTGWTGTKSPFNMCPLKIFVNHFKFWLEK